jgi:hypothetical protein
MSIFAFSIDSTKEIFLLSFFRLIFFYVSGLDELGTKVQDEQDLVA